MPVQSPSLWFCQTSFKVATKFLNYSSANLDLFYLFAYLCVEALSLKVQKKREIVLLILLARSLGAQSNSARDTASCPVCMNLSHILPETNLKPSLQFFFQT